MFSVPRLSSSFCIWECTWECKYTGSLHTHPNPSPFHTLHHSSHSPTHASHPPTPTIVSPLVHKVRICPILQQHTEDGGEVSLCCHVQDPTLVVVHITHTCLGQQLGGEMVASKVKFQFQVYVHAKVYMYGRLASFLGSRVRRRKEE